MLLPACAGWEQDWSLGTALQICQGGISRDPCCHLTWHRCLPSLVPAPPAAPSQESHQRLPGTRVTSRRVGVPLSWQGPETPVVGLMDRFGFLEWPAQLGRCGIKRLIHVQLCVLLHTGGLVQLCLAAAPVQMWRDWSYLRFGFLPVSENTRDKPPAETLLICLFGGTFLHVLSFGAAPTVGWE